MKRVIITFDIQDLPVMIGGGFLLSSVASVVSDAFFHVPLHHHLSLLIASVGFLAGGFLSQYARHKKEPSETNPSQKTDKDVSSHE